MSRRSRREKVEALRGLSKEELSHIRGLMAKNRESNDVISRFIEPREGQLKALMRRIKRQLKEYSKNPKVDGRIPVMMDRGDMLIANCALIALASKIVEQEFERNLLEAQTS